LCCRLAMTVVFLCHAVNQLAVAASALPAWRETILADRCEDRYEVDQYSV